MYLFPLLHTDRNEFVCQAWRYSSADPSSTIHGRPRGHIGNSNPFVIPLARINSDRRPCLLYRVRCIARIVLNHLRQRRGKKAAAFPTMCDLRLRHPRTCRVIRVGIFAKPADTFGTPGQPAINLESLAAKRSHVWFTPVSSLRTSMLAPLTHSPPLSISRLRHMLHETPLSDLHGTECMAIECEPACT